MTQTVHYYRSESSREVQAVLAERSFTDGDVLILDNEEIVAIVYDSVPVALTVKHGEFLPPINGGKAYRRAYPESVKAAEMIAVERNWPLDIEPPF